jgi:hypothetical protein
MPATAPVAPDQDVDESPAFWEADQLPPSARVADRVLGTCRAAGCAPLSDRRPQRWTPLRQATATRRMSR